MEVGEKVHDQRLHRQDEDQDADQHKDDQRIQDVLHNVVEHGLSLVVVGAVSLTENSDFLLIFAAFWGIFKRSIGFLDCVIA